MCAGSYESGSQACMHTAMMLYVRLQVRPFIRTEETKSKIVFLSGSERAAALHEHIPPQVSKKCIWGLRQQGLSATKSVQASN